MPVDPSYTVERLQELVRIDSRNPASEADAPGEKEIANRVRAELESIGWRAELHDLGDDRCNVVAVRRGSGEGPSLVIDVHLDTVGVAGMAEPFSGALRDGRVWGRGAQDTKGGMAAVLGMAKALADEDARMDGDLVLAFVADEEHGSLGTTALLERITPDAAIVIEPSGLDVCVAHRGFGIFRLETRGRTAHGGRPDVGVDANLGMARLLVAIETAGRGWSERHEHPLLGSASLHVPLLSGGRQLFVYADRCTADLECRTVPGQTEAETHDALREIAAAVGAGEYVLRAEVEPVLWRSPWEVDVDRPVVRSVRAAVEAVRQAGPRTIGHPWWEDAALFGEAGIDAVVLGPTGEGLHTEEEWVDVQSIVDLAEILRRSAINLCRRH